MKSLSLFFKKITFGKALLLSFSPIVVALLNMKSILLALSVIIVIDMITGIRKSLFQKEVAMNPFKKIFWDSINSSGLRSTWRKTYEYVIGILVFVILDGMVLGTTSFEILGGTHSLSEMAVTIACFVEVYSVYENMEAVSGNNLFKKMINFLPAKFKSMFSTKK